jgi:hypothetical protein
MLEAFDQFLAFTYSKYLDCMAFQALDEEEKWVVYSKLYVLAGYLDAQALKSTIVGILFSQIANARFLRQSANITAQVINYIYSRRPPDKNTWGSGDESFRKTEALNDLDTWFGERVM